MTTRVLRTSTREKKQRKIAIPVLESADVKRHARLPAGVRRVKAACTNCKKAKARCDHGRPCSRCVERGLDNCVDAYPKRVGRRRQHFFDAIVTAEDVERLSEARSKENKSRRRRRGRAKGHRSRSAKTALPRDRGSKRSRLADDESRTPPLTPSPGPLTKRFKSVTPLRPPSLDQLWGSTMWPHDNMPTSPVEKKETFLMTSPVLAGSPVFAGPPVSVASPVFAAPMARETEVATAPTSPWLPITPIEFPGSPNGSKEASWGSPQTPKGLMLGDEHVAPWNRTKASSSGFTPPTELSLATDLDLFHTHGDESDGAASTPPHKGSPSPLQQHAQNEDLVLDLPLFDPAACTLDVETGHDPFGVAFVPATLVTH